MAVGLVVDDAIVVLENITRHHEKGKSSFEAALEGAREIGFAIVAMTLTLASVYAPLAFISGTMGQLFTEFAVTLAGSVLVSGFVALTLSPLMCQYLVSSRARASAQVEGPQNYYNNPWILRLQRFAPSLRMTSVETSYQHLLDRVLHWNGKIILSIFGGAFLGLCFLYKMLPHELAPKEDRGFIGAFIPLIPGLSMDAMEERSLLVEKITDKIQEAERSMVFQGEWGASICLPLKPHKDRSQSAADLVNQLMPQLMSLPSMDAWPWSWDTGLPGVDSAGGGGGITIQLLTIDSFKRLGDVATKLCKNLRETGLFSEVYHQFKEVPSMEVHLNHSVLATTGLTPSDIALSIQIFFSGVQNLTFFKDTFSYPITIQGKEKPYTLDELYLTTPQGDRLAASTVATLELSAKPKTLTHFNQMRAVAINGTLNPGIQLGSAMEKTSATLKETLPLDFKYSWDGVARLYLKSATSLFGLLAMSLIFIYAILAIQFESFVDPLIVMMTVPLACLGSFIFMKFTGSTINIYTQIGLITLIGLITKHGILIVEFANQRLHQGEPLLNAVKTATLLRLRPILMTTGAMVFGAIPLILSSSAGHEARFAIGIVVIGGLLTGTVLTLILLPSLYVLVKKQIRTR